VARGWTIGGVGEPTRAAVTAAASEAGISLGQWVEQALKKALAEGLEPGVPLEEIEARRRQAAARVERVTVQAGGQAIVGAVTQRGGDYAESEDRPHALAHAPEPALRCQDPPRQSMPISGGQGSETVPNARGSTRQRRTARQ
jgi:hypothetical protein